MIICFDCKGNTKKILDSLVDSGQYKDYNEIINLSIENLALLETEIKKGGGLIIQSKNEILPKEMINEKNNISQPFFSTMSSKEFIKNKFYLPSKPPDQTLISRTPEDEWANKTHVPIGDWLFGQYNRLLPIKISTRSIANHQTEQNKGLLIDEIPMVIAKEALTLGKYLSYIEEEKDLGRDDLLSVAFPNDEKDEEKSLLRFANQFVVSRNSNNKLQGLLADLKLINFSELNSYERISLTKPGWEFTMLKNPILENFQENPSQKFSYEEILFLIDHIINNVPKEKFAFQIIIKELVNGNNTPHQIDTAIEQRISSQENSMISKSFLSTQRSGAVSRMIDLELVKRIREGIRVRYIATRLGKDNFLK